MYIYVYMYICTHTLPFYILEQAKQGRFMKVLL